MRKICLFSRTHFGVLALGTFLFSQPVQAQKEEFKPFFKHSLQGNDSAADAAREQTDSAAGRNAFALTATSSAVLPGASDIYLKASYLKWGFARDLLSDQFAIWQSPGKLKKKDLRWLLPIAISTAAVMPFDQQASDALRGRFEGGSLNFSMAGGPMSMATSAAIFGIAQATKKPYLRETGLLSMRAVANTWLTVKTLKFSTNRERPIKDGVEQDGRFWGGGRSFPSGHSAETWAMATVIAERYSNKPWIRFGAYAFAAGISFSRVSGQKHFPSDVLVGALVGNLIGRYVVRSWQKKKEMLVLENRLLSRPQQIQLP